LSCGWSTTYRRQSVEFLAFLLVDVYIKGVGNLGTTTGLTPGKLQPITT